MHGLCGMMQGRKLKGYKGERGIKCLVVERWGGVRWEFWVGWCWVRVVLAGCVGQVAHNHLIPEIWKKGCAIIFPTLPLPLDYRTTQCLCTRMWYLG